MISNHDCKLHIQCLLHAKYLSRVHIYFIHHLRLGLVTKLNILNPKACSVIELYGILDPVTRDWTDGLLSNIFREVNKPTDKNERRYILFDGDVDALWVENMNSVMDDNKLLTLANGEQSDCRSTVPY